MPSSNNRDMPPSVRRGRLLLVDDEPQKIQLWIQALTEAGFDVLSVPSAAQALSAVDSGESFDVIIIDVMMPAGDDYANENTAGGLRTGVLLARDLRARGIDVPIVVLTNVEHKRTLQELAPLTQALLSKVEFTPRRAASRVRALFDKSRTGSQALHHSATSERPGISWAPSESGERPSFRLTSDDELLKRARYHRDVEAFAAYMDRHQSAALDTARSQGLLLDTCSNIPEEARILLWRELAYLEAADSGTRLELLSRACMETTLRGATPEAGLLPPLDLSA